MHPGSWCYFFCWQSVWHCLIQYSKANLIYYFSLAEMLTSPKLTYNGISRSGSHMFSHTTVYDAKCVCIYNYTEIAIIIQKQSFNVIKNICICTFIFYYKNLCIHKYICPSWVHHEKPWAGGRTSWNLLLSFDREKYQ